VRAATSSCETVQKLPVHSAEGRGTWSWPNLPASERQQRISSQAAPQGPQPPRSSLERPEAAVGIALACAGLLLAAALALVLVRRRRRAQKAHLPGGSPSTHAAAASTHAEKDEAVRSFPPIADEQLSECEVELLVLWFRRTSGHDRQPLHAAGTTGCHQGRRMWQPSLCKDPLGRMVWQHSCTHPVPEQQSSRVCHE
jgi:hypothetical protein